MFSRIRAKQTPVSVEAKGPATPSQQKAAIPGAKDVGFTRTLVALQPAPVGPAVKQLFPVAIQRDGLQTAEQVASVLARQLGQPGLEPGILETLAAATPKAQAALLQTLASYALLGDSATTMLDYSKLHARMGWEGWAQVWGVPDNFPTSRRAYRAREYQPFNDKVSAPRRDQSRAELGAVLHQALGAKKPVAALEQALVDRFYAELGLPAEITQDWKATAQTIGQALDQEALIPLRALYDASAALDHRGVDLYGHSKPFLNESSRAVVTEMIRHVAEGDFGEWRFANSQEQLQSLSPEQLTAYRAPRSIERDSKKGIKLKTRDAQGFDLAWVTKIAGPSHGFDMLSQCLLPLLGNARNGAIVVDAEGWPGAARSTLRMLPDADGKPMLYVEMTQVDFEFDDKKISRDDFRRAILEHAIEKAKAMGVPLAVAPSKYENIEEIAESLGLKGERKQLRIVLEPSNSVFESSDTLMGHHHGPQLERRLVEIPREVPKLQLYNPFPFVIQPGA